MIGLCRIVVFVVALMVTFEGAIAQTDYRNAQDAFNDGARLVNMRKFADAQAPLEAALKLAQDDAFKRKVYRALIPSYRQLPTIDKMLEAKNFLFEHNESAVENSLLARSLASFVHERGKTAEVVKIYEGQLAKDPKSKPALYALTEIYHRADPQPERRTKLLSQLEEIQKDDAAKEALNFETLAAQEPQLAGVHWKDAAAAWLRAKDPKRALAAAQNAETAGPDTRSDLLAYFWCKAMGDIYLELDQPKQAIPHLEMAKQKTTIAGYVKACDEQLAKARAASMK